MKRKIIFAALLVAMLVGVFALSTSAFEFETPSYSVTAGGIPSRDAIEDMFDIYYLQAEMGFVFDGTVNLVYTQTSSGLTTIYFIVGRSVWTSSITTSSSTFSFKFSSQYRLGWNEDSGFFYTSSPTSLSLKPTDIVYCSTNVPQFSASLPSYQGYNPNYSFGSFTARTQAVLNYYTSIYNHIVNYDTDVQNALATGQSYGYQLGKAECEATHGEGTYQDGYDYGYSVGLSDCDKTHQTLKDEAYGDGFSYGLSQGAMSGFADCQATHPALLKEAQDVGYAAGDADGYMRGLKEGAENKKEELDLEYWRGRSEGYDYGYTQALESSDAVLDYVDGIFSAPINFLYSAFNIEILGINLFNVIMLFLSLLIVGGVVLLVLKFR